MSFENIKIEEVTPEKESGIEKIVVERTKKEIKELEEITGGKEEGVLRRIGSLKKAVIAVSAGLALFIATEAWAGPKNMFDELDQKITEIKKQPSEIENFPKNMEKQRKDFEQQKEIQEAPMRENPERAEINFKRMKDFRHNVFVEEVIPNSIQRSRSNLILQKHFLYMDDSLSEEDYEKYIDHLNKVSGDVFNGAALLNLKNKSE